MSVRRMLLAAALLSLLPRLSAEAAILIEARKHGEPFRMVIDNEQQRALISTARGESLVDLQAGQIYIQGPGGVARRVPIGSQPLPASSLYRVEPWGPGPVIAGQSTVYHVISYGDQICAEMLVSGWMKPFVAPVVQALDLLEDLSGTPRGRGCERIPFSVYAAAGLADHGRQDRPPDLRDAGACASTTSRRRMSWPCRCTTRPRARTRPCSRPSPPSPEGRRSSGDGRFTRHPRLRSPIAARIRRR